MKLPDYLFEHKPVNRAAKPHIVFALTLSGLETVIDTHSRRRAPGDSLPYSIIDDVVDLSVMSSSWHSVSYWIAVAANVRRDHNGTPIAFAGPFPPEFQQYALHASAFLDGKQVAVTVDRRDQHELSPEKIAELPLNLITLEMPEPHMPWQPGFHGAIQRDWI